MEGDALEVRLCPGGQGVELQMGETKFFFDPRSTPDGGVHCISHAHSDHLPSATKKLEGRSIVCSPITATLASKRLKRPLIKPIVASTHPDVEMLNAGHIAGSNMFLVKGGRTVLYTGDMSTRDRFGIEGARPIKTDVLIIESTYGDPSYKFPATDKIARVIKDWVEDSMSSGYSTALFAYPLGKSQELIRMLSEFEPFIEGSVLECTRHIESHGTEYCYRPFDATNGPDTPCVMVCSTNAKNGLTSRMRRGHLRTAAVSGWAISSSFKYQMGVDEAFPFSDHADFEELIEFVKGCDPEVVYTHHGSADTLAEEIKRRLGIEAKSLLPPPKQRRLGDFE
ncbi:MAG: MBL fold metallo-hydrolase [Methanomassiliicoccales archaeon]|jgi:putative mRNA 3-end processing factor